MLVSLAYYVLSAQKFKMSAPCQGSGLAVKAGSFETFRLSAKKVHIQQSGSCLHDFLRGYITFIWQMLLSKATYSKCIQPPYEQELDAWILSFFYFFFKEM